MFIQCSLFHFTVQQNEEGHIWLPHPDHCDCDTYPMYSILLVIKHTTNSSPEDQLLLVLKKKGRNQNRTTCLTFNQFQHLTKEVFFTKGNRILLVLHVKDSNPGCAMVEWFMTDRLVLRAGTRWELSTRVCMSENLICPISVMSLFKKRFN